MGAFCRQRLLQQPHSGAKSAHEHACRRGIGRVRDHFSSGTLVRHRSRPVIRERLAEAEQILRRARPAPWAEVRLAKRQGGDGVVSKHPYGACRSRGAVPERARRVPTGAQELVHPVERDQEPETRQVSVVQRDPLSGGRTTGRGCRTAGRCV